jgi:hypothetical protein
LTLAAEEHSGYVVARDTAGIEEDVDTGAELLRTAVGAEDIVERRGRIFTVRLVAVGICAVLQEPLNRYGLDGLARGEDDREIAVPLRVYVRAVGEKELHHGDAMTEQRGAHQWTVIALMLVGPVFDHPPRYCQPFGSGRLPGHATFGYPSERAVFGVAQRSAMQRWVARHKTLHSFDVVAVDGLLEFADLFRGIPRDP